jgi:hypothetical protein
MPMNVFLYKPDADLPDLTNYLNQTIEVVCSHEGKNRKEVCFKGKCELYKTEVLGF